MRPLVLSKKPNFIFSEGKKRPYNKNIIWMLSDIDCRLSNQRSRREEAKFHIFGRLKGLITKILFRCCQIWVIGNEMKALDVSILILNEGMLSTE